MEKEFSEFIKQWKELIEDIKTRSYDQRKCRALYNRFNIQKNELLLFNKIKGESDFFEFERLRTELHHAVATTISNFEKEKRGFWTRIVEAIGSKIPTP